MLVREISEKNNLPFADVMWKYLGEDLLYKISEAGVNDYIWREETN